uniref:Putative secreted peptide n=1 Tax=Anopheles braziliensis TaxID=58242 RepID=A0A2M3ZNM7_9DIPT
MDCWPAVPVAASVVTACVGQLLAQDRRPATSTFISNRTTPVAIRWSGCNQRCSTSSSTYLRSSSPTTCIRPRPTTAMATTITIMGPIRTSRRRRCTRRAPSAAMATS